MKGVSRWNDAVEGHSKLPELFWANLVLRQTSGAVEGWKDGEHKLRAGDQACRFRFFYYLSVCDIVEKTNFIHNKHSTCGSVVGWL